MAHLAGQGREGTWTGRRAGLPGMNWRVRLRPVGHRTQWARGWGGDGQEQGQGQMVLPRAPAAQGVPAGLELQASPVRREQ